MRTEYYAKFSYVLSKFYLPKYYVIY